MVDGPMAFTELWSTARPGWLMAQMGCRSIFQFSVVNFRQQVPTIDSIIKSILYIICNKVNNVHHGDHLW